jgi:hypothetical protein
MPWRNKDGVEVSLYSFLNLSTSWVWVVNGTPRPLYPREWAGYPLYRRLCGPQGRSGRVRNISPPPAFDPRTVQPVASHYTDWAIPAQSNTLQVLSYIKVIRLQHLKARYLGVPEQWVSGGERYGWFYANRARGETIWAPAHYTRKCDVTRNDVVAYNNSLGLCFTPQLSLSLSSFEFKPRDNFLFYDTLFSCHHISLLHTPQPAFLVSILPSFV